MYIQCMQGRIRDSGDDVAVSHSLKKTIPLFHPHRFEKYDSSKNRSSQILSSHWVDWPCLYQTLFVGFMIIMIITTNQTEITERYLSLTTKRDPIIISPDYPRYSRVSSRETANFKSREIYHYCALNIYYIEMGTSYHQRDQFGDAKTTWYCGKMIAFTAPQAPIISGEFTL